MDGAEPPGAHPIARYVESAINDNKTWLQSSPPAGYTVWWTTSTTPRLGYQRFGNIVSKTDALANAYGAAHTLDNGYLKVEYNKIWGDAPPRGGGYPALAFFGAAGAGCRKRSYQSR